MTNRDKILAWAEREGTRACLALAHAPDGAHVGNLLFWAQRLDRAAASLRLGVPDLGMGPRVPTAKTVGRYARETARARAAL